MDQTITAVLGFSFVIGLNGHFPTELVPLIEHGHVLRGCFVRARRLREQHQRQCHAYARHSQSRYVREL